MLLSEVFPLELEVVVLLLAHEVLDVVCKLDFNNILLQGLGFVVFDLGHEGEHFALLDEFL